MAILLSNDDGIQAPGLRALVEAYRRSAQIVVSAPEHPRSAVSNSITLHKPLRIAERTDGRVRWISMNGTPADAVKLALCELLPRAPDLVISGINHGLNTGSNVLYSGTVAAALEAALHGVPAFAVSVEWSPRTDFRRAARTARAVIERIRSAGPLSGTVYNINIPSKRRLRGVLVTQQEKRPYLDRFERRTDPRGRPYFWILGHPDPAYGLSVGSDGRCDPPTDAWACAHGYVSVTPLVRDLTHHTSLPHLQRAFSRPVRDTMKGR